MESFLWIGSTIGAAIGVLHGAYLFREISTRASTPGLNARGLYYALWTFILWTVFGSYVLFFWLVGVIANQLIHIIPSRNSD